MSAGSPAARLARRHGIRLARAARWVYGVGKPLRGADHLLGAPGLWTLGADGLSRTRPVFAVPAALVRSDEVLERVVEWMIETAGAPEELAWRAPPPDEVKGWLTGCPRSLGSAGGELVPIHVEHVSDALRLSCVLASRPVGASRDRRTRWIRQMVRELRLHSPMVRCGLVEDGSDVECVRAQIDFRGAPIGLLEELLPFCLGEFRALTPALDPLRVLCDPEAAFRSLRISPRRHGRQTRKGKRQHEDAD